MQKHRFHHQKRPFSGEEKAVLVSQNHVFARKQSLYCGKHLLYMLPFSLKSLKTKC